MKLSEKIKVSFIQLGLHIRMLREKRQLSLKELSKITGIRKEYLSKIEQGNAYGILIERHLFKIAKSFDIKLSELLDFEDIDI